MMQNNKKVKKNRMKTSRHITLLAMFVAIALVFSYMETFIPLNFAVPGIKIGLANIVTIIVLVQMGMADAFAVSVVRICLAAILFGNMSVMVYSLAGAVFSILIMKLVYMTGLFGITGVSICGGVAHNIGQIVTAALLMENQNIIAYAPVLIISGTITGVMVGLASAAVSKSVRLQ